MCGAILLMIKRMKASNVVPYYNAYNNFNIKFSHASPKRMSICGTKSEMILQALYYFGKSRVDDTMIKRISNMLSKEDKEHLIQDARFSPAWIILVVNKIKGDK